MASLNSKYNPGDFDIMVEIKAVIGHTDEVNQVPVYSMCYAMWAMEEKATQVKATQVKDADVDAATVRLVLRRWDRKITAHSYLVKYYDEWYQVIEVNHIGRVHTAVIIKKMTNDGN